MENRKSPQTPTSDKRLGTLTASGRFRLNEYRRKAAGAWVALIFIVPFLIPLGGGVLMASSRSGGAFAFGIGLSVFGLGMSSFVLKMFIRAIARRDALDRAAAAEQALFILGVLEAVRPGRGGRLRAFPEIEYQVSGVWHPVVVEGVGSRVGEIHPRRLGQSIVLEVVPERPTMLLSMAFPDAAPSEQRMEAMKDEDWTGFDKECLGESWGGPLLLAFMVMLACLAAALEGWSSFLAFTVLALSGAGGATYFMSGFRKDRHRRGVQKRVVEGELEETMWGRTYGKHARLVWSCRVGGQLHSVPCVLMPGGAIPDWFRHSGRVRIEYAVRGRQRWFLRLVRLQPELTQSEVEANTARGRGGQRLVRAGRKTQA